MTIINYSVLTDQANKLFEILKKAPELNGLTLVGGTALALQIGHRVSLDFDFASFTGSIPSYNIDSLIENLKQTGLNVHEITNPQNESQFRINTGEQLRDHVRDYIVNKIKLTFIAHGRTKLQRKFYSGVHKIQSDDMSFNIMGLEGLKTSKTLVLADRVQSRDLYDLMMLMENHHYTIENLVSVIKELGHIDDPEHYRAVMTGLIKIDLRDDGLMPVDIHYSVEDIYEYFESQYEKYDILQSIELFSGKTNIYDFIVSKETNYYLGSSFKGSLNDAKDLYQVRIAEIELDTKTESGFAFISSYNTDQPSMVGSINKKNRVIWLDIKSNSKQVRQALTYWEKINHSNIIYL